MSCRHLVLTRKAEEQKYAGPPKWPLRGTRPDRGARRGGSSSPPSATLEGPAPRTRQNAPTRISNREYLHIIQTHHKAHRQMSLLFEEFRFRPIAQKELQPAPTRWLAPGRRRRRCHNRPSRMCVRRSNAVASARAPSTPDSAVLPRVALPCTRFQSCRNTRKIQNRSKMSKESTHLCTGRGCHSQA